MLSSPQFGARRSLTEYVPPSHGSQLGNPHPVYYADTEAPLPHADYSNSSAKQASAWRRPHKIMPYGAATRGSTFTPWT